MTRTAAAARKRDPDGCRGAPGSATLADADGQRQGRPIPATRDVRLWMARPGGTQLGISMDRWMPYAHVT
jgi:hypothetical protein